MVVVVVIVVFVIINCLFINSSKTRENEVREHIPVPYDNLFQSIFVFAPRCEF